MKEESEEGSSTSIDIVDIVEKSEREIHRVLQKYNDNNIGVISKQNPLLINKGLPRSFNRIRKSEANINRFDSKNVSPLSKRLFNLICSMS